VHIQLVLNLIQLTGILKGDAPVERSKADPDE